MRLDRPGARVATSRTMSFTEVLDLCPKHWRAAPVPAAGHDWRRRDGAAAPRGPRDGSAACEPWCDCGQLAVWPGLLPPRVATVRTAPRVASQARHRLVSSSARPPAGR